MALSGYPPDDLLSRPSFVNACAEELAALATDAVEIASVVGFLAGAGASYLTATTIFADGGLMQGSVGL